jgi:hypothetical protein
VAPTYTAGQAALQSEAQSTLSQALNGTNLTPLQVQGAQQINQSYQGMGDRLLQSLSSRGFAKSGLIGSEQLQTNLAQAGAQGNLQNSLESYAAQHQLDAVNAAGNIAFRNPTTTSTSTGSNVYSGSSTAAGSTAAGALSGGLTSLIAQLNAANAASAYSGGS